MNFCRKLGPDGLGLLKAASYLLHEGSFSSCREFLLSNCRVIVQDDSGIPHHYFTPQHWQLRYFGSYVGTTGGPFAKYYQPDLAAAYANANAASIDFQLSYQWDRGKANLLVAARTGSAQVAQPAPPVVAKTKSTTTAKAKSTAKKSTTTKKTATKPPEPANPFSFLFGPKEEPVTAPAAPAKKHRRKTS
jgi:hypothetical protein